MENETNTVCKLYPRYDNCAKYAAKIEMAKPEDRLSLIYQYVKTNKIGLAVFTKMVSDYVK